MIGGRLLEHMERPFCPVSVEQADWSTTGAKTLTMLDRPTPARARTVLSSNLRADRAARRERTARLGRLL
jgi:hypothetical protein